MGAVISGDTVIFTLGDNGTRQTMKHFISKIGGGRKTFTIEKALAKVIKFRWIQYSGSMRHVA